MFSRCLVAIWVAVWAVSAHASGLCETATRLAAKQLFVPQNSLVALALLESGAQGNAPSPWAVAIDGVTRDFPTQTLAVAHVREAINAGHRQFRIGCFQILHRYDERLAAPVLRMFDPVLNSQRAARYLISFRKKASDWTQALAAYHTWDWQGPPVRSSPSQTVLNSDPNWQISALLPNGDRR